MQEGEHMLKHRQTAPARLRRRTWRSVHCTVCRGGHACAGAQADCACVPATPQVPPDQLEAFAEVRDGLQDTSEFSFKELEADVRQVFDQFIQ